MNEQAIEKVKEHFGTEILKTEEIARQTIIYVKPERILEILRMLRDDSLCAFNYLQDITCLDYMNQGMSERFCVVYNLYSFNHNSSIRIKAFVSENNPKINSVSSLWASADWAEREVYDMYGIEFLNHPNLKRILMPDDYHGYPLRKDYPLQGKGERDNFPKYTGDE